MKWIIPKALFIGAIEMRYKSTIYRNKFQDHFKAQNYITNTDIREMCVVSAATSNLILLDLAVKEKLIKC